MNAPNTVALAAVALLAASLTAGPAHAQPKQPEPGQNAYKLKTQIVIDVELDYLLSVPEGYGKAEDKDKKWPLILFLHGSGERGSDVKKVKVHGPPKLAERKDKNVSEFIVLSPQCPDGKWWDPQALIALLDDVSSRYAVDADRVYLTGLSMGGFGTWDTASAHPDRFAAIAPVCGGGNKYRARGSLKDIPTWVFHGEKDEAVPVAASEEMVAALKAAGGDVQFTRYPNVGHDSWTATYDNPELYAWFLKHTRKTEKGAEKK